MGSQTLPGIYPKPKKTKHLGLHIDDELHYKLHYVAGADGRSANGEVLFVLRRYIAEFEAVHGKIELTIDPTLVG